jgi:DNA-binding NtrC family response regulator
MNFSKPIIICDESEEFRNLLREMLIKNGFFHLVEASNAEEIKDALKERKEAFILIHSRLITNEIEGILLKQNDYIVFADNQEPSTVILAAKMGVNHIMSYPFHSRKLLEKMSSF